MSEIRRPILKPYSKDRFELVEPYSVTMPIFKSGSAEEITVEVPKGYKCEKKLKFYEELLNEASK